MAFTTCTVPGFVYLLGETVPAWTIAIAIAATTVALGPLALRAATDRGDSLTAPDLAVPSVT